MKKIEKEKARQKEYLRQLKTARKNHHQFDFSGDIVLEGVSYTYAKKSPFEFKALNKADLTIEKDQVTAIIGTTGSGKSTIVQLMNGLLITETGRSVIGDYPIPAAVKKIPEVKALRKEIGLVFQFPEYQLFQDTVEKDIAFGPIHLGANKLETIKQVPELLKLVDLPVEFLTRSPFELSGGQKRRVAIAGIIAMNGKTLILDEPTGGLDPQGEEDFMNLFARLNQKQNKRIIMITHNMDQVLRIADQVVVMHKGRIIAKGSPFAVFSDAELLKTIEIEPPKIYQLLYKLKAQGLDLTKKEIRSIPDFVKAYQEAIKKA